MYEHFLNLDYWRYDDKRTADLFEKAQKFSRFFAYVFDSLADVVTQFIILSVGLIALILVNWWLGLILIIAVIPGIIIQFNLSKAQIRHRNMNIENRRKSSMIEHEMVTINAIAELKLYGTIRYLLDMRIKLREMDEKERINFERKYVFKQFIAKIIEALAQVLALVFTTFQIINRNQPVGYFIYIQVIVSRALSESNTFVSQLNSIDEDIANLFDYQEFMSLPISKNREIKLIEQPDDIIMNNISFHYPGAKLEVIRNMSLTIKRFEHIAIVGENGAGKSTLIRLILGLYNPTMGEIYLDNHNLKDIVPGTWHKYIGVLQQEFVKYSFATARDNVYFGDISSPKDLKRFHDAIEAAEARTFLEKLPKGLKSYVDQWMEHNDGTSGVNLSGGQWQRLALARNFYRNSPIIILDEPSSAIDALAESRIFKRLMLDKKRTIITISHRLTTIEKADIIYMLKNGVVVEKGSHGELIAKKGFYYEMFKSQLNIIEN